MSAVADNALAVKTDFSGNEKTFAVQETASTMAAAQGKAMVESRYIMAMRQPRIWDQVRLDILTECKRPSFANNKSVYYIKPIGQGVEGLGIRFVESALRHMKNVLIEPVMLFEDETKEIQRVTVTDLESNITYSTDVRVSKTVERSKPMDDGSYISVRINSYNKKVYTVPANDDDLLNKRGALISKAVRTLGLRIVPGDIQDEAIELIKNIRMDDAAKDPTAKRKRIVDEFDRIGVKASDLVAYLEHSLDSCSPAELVHLTAIWSSINDGEATWKTVMENKAEQSGIPPEGKGAGRTETPMCTAEEFKDKSAGWRKTIIEKRKTPAQLIAMIESKTLLTEDQKTTIDAWSHEND